MKLIFVKCKCTVFKSKLSIGTGMDVDLNWWDVLKTQILYLELLVDRE